VTDRLSQLKEQFEEMLKEREVAYTAKIKELAANTDQGACVSLAEYIHSVLTQPFPSLSSHFLPLAANTCSTLSPESASFGRMYDREMRCSS